jgi:hypothetical protein
MRCKKKNRSTFKHLQDADTIERDDAASVVAPAAAPAAPGAGRAAAAAARASRSSPSRSSSPPAASTPSQQPPSALTARATEAVIPVDEAAPTDPNAKADVQKGNVVPHVPTTQKTKDELIAHYVEMGTKKLMAEGGPVKTRNKMLPKSEQLKDAKNTYTLQQIAAWLVERDLEEATKLSAAEAAVATSVDLTSSWTPDQKRRFGTRLLFLLFVQFSEEVIPAYLQTGTYMFCSSFFLQRILFSTVIQTKIINIF